MNWKLYEKIVGVLEDSMRQGWMELFFSEKKEEKKGRYIPVMNFIRIMCGVLD